MNLQFTPQQAAVLADRATRLALAGRELGAFGETEPELAGTCGVEVCALEARTLLSGGALSRIVKTAGESVQKGRPAVLSADDIEAMSRLEGVVALASSRIGLKQASLEAEAGQEGIAKIGSLLGLAAGAWGFIKSLWGDMSCNVGKNGLGWGLPVVLRSETTTPVKDPRQLAQSKAEEDCADDAMGWPSRRRKRRPLDELKGEEMSLPVKIQSMPVNKVPGRLPEGGGMFSASKSVFEDPVRGTNAEVRIVPLLGLPSPVRQESIIPVPSRPQPQSKRPMVVARPAMGQTEHMEVERLIQRELPPIGLSRTEASTLAEALVPALQASAAALEESITCGKVDSSMVDRVRALKDQLLEFSKDAGPEDRLELDPGEFADIDEILSCEETYGQVASVRRQRSVAFLVGGLALGAFILAVAT